jgi:hypothetical protein
MDWHQNITWKSREPGTYWEHLDRTVDSGETYQFEVGNTLINAEKEVNSLRYVNHRCENENVVAIAVNINGTDRCF